MKKALKITLIIIIAAVLLIISAFTIIFISSADEIVSTEKNAIANSIQMLHETKKGEKIEFPIAVTKKMLGEDLYLIDVLLNEPNNENYSTKHTRLEINLDISVEILMMFYSAGNGSNYIIPSVSYNDNQQTFKCSSDDGYAHLKLLLSGEEAKNLKLTVKYSIIGNGIYSFNKFYGFEETLGLDDFN